MVVACEYGISRKMAQGIRRRIMGLYPQLDDVIILIGKERTTLQLIGDEKGINPQDIKGIKGVAKYLPVQNTYKLASREYHPEDTVIKVGDVEIGEEFVVMAGPCSVERKMITIARDISNAGARILRGGAFKPRKSPYSYQGMGEKGLELLCNAGRVAGLPVITEVMDTADIELVAQYADILQIGMRNSRDYALLRELSQVKKPVLLKRGDSCRFDDWMLSAEYVLLGKGENGSREYSGGNPNVMLCERGILSFDPANFRNTFDINALAKAKRESHLPVIADPSHGTGERGLVVPVGLAAVVAGADGLLVEVHPNPGKAKSDGAQTINLKALELLVKAGEEQHTLRKRYGNYDVD